MPLNVMDAHYRSFEQRVLPELVQQTIGVLGMKSLANGIMLQSHTVTASEGLHYALNLPKPGQHILDVCAEVSRPYPVCAVIPSTPSSAQ
jgi:hypothetical protein